MSTNQFWSDDEIRDYVVGPDGYREVRQQNDAANRELYRRGYVASQEAVPSGEVAPFWIEWVNTGDGSVVVEAPAGALLITERSTTVPQVNTLTAMVLSQPTPADLVIYRGDSGRFRVTVTDPDSAPVDVSAAAWRCEIRGAATDVDPLATLAVQPVAGDTASVDVILTTDQSNLLVKSGVWDLEMTVGAEVQTLMAGKVTVTQDVSRP